MRVSALLLCSCAFLSGVTLTSASAIAGPTTKVTEGHDGSQTDSDSSGNITPDGRYVVIESYATNLVAGDTNNHSDIFVYDRQTDTMERVSVASDGTQANNSSFNPQITPDGRYVVFDSYATNLIAGDTNGNLDVFRHDRQTDTTIRVSVADDESESDGNSDYSSISDSGQYVVFRSAATNFLGVGGDLNGVNDVYLRDCVNNTTARMSEASDGTEANDFSRFPVISGNGDVIAFSSAATNLVAVDGNACLDVFAKVRATGAITRLSVDTAGNDSDNHSDSPSISMDGRYIAFMSTATDLVAGDTNGNDDVFIRDNAMNATVMVSKLSDGTLGNNDSENPMISHNGQYVAFVSRASNFVAGDTNGTRDAFLCNIAANTIERVSTDSNGVESNDMTISAAVTDNGRFIAMSSIASNLVAGDTNGMMDVFIKDMNAPAPSSTVPTMSEWGMIIMAALMALSALVMRRKRATA